MDLLTIFFTGLAIGGVSCLAVQGGLLASTIAAREEADLDSGTKKRHTILPTVAFLVTKFIAYIILGFALGAFGGALQISDQVKIWMQLLAGLYMLAVAGNLLNLHPIFRYAIIQPPKFLTRKIRNQAKSADLFAPAFLGAMTIFIPCGTTLAMETLAISSGNPLSGALIMGVFILGTSPLFLALGYITTVLGDAFQRRFLKIAAILVIYLGLSSINGSLVVMGSPVTWQTIAENFPIQINLNGDDTGSSSNADLVKAVDGVQVADIQLLAAGYNPNYIKVKKGIPVKLNLTQVGNYSCTSAFVIPSLNISRRLPRGGTDSVEFTPTQTGKINWTCSMGMYYGTIEVVE